MYKGHHFINAGTVEIYRWGKKARALVESYKAANENGWISIPVDGDKYYSIGTSKSKYGEFAKFGDTFFTVNSVGCIYAKEGTPKAEILRQLIDGMLDKMNSIIEENAAYNEEQIEKYNAEVDAFMASFN